MKAKYYLAVAAVCVAGLSRAQESYSYSYWFDSSPDISAINGSDVASFTVDASTLPLGLHRLNVMARDEKGEVSSVSSCWFIKTFYPDSGQKSEAIFYIDGSAAKTENITFTADGIATLEPDFSSIDCGMHRIGVNIVSQDEAVSDYRERFFYRLPTTSEMETFDGYYLIDNEHEGRIHGGSSEILNLNIDVASLTSGFHTLSLFMATPKGYATNFHNSFFYKIPLGGEGVKSYTYWVNSDRSHAITTHLDKVTNPLSLITMLDMPLQPFRSCDFELDLSGSMPMLYARNTLHFESYDSDNMASYSSADYVDGRVSRPLDLSDVEPLSPGTESLNIQALGDNEIRWFSFSGQPGGCLVYSSDKGCMIDIFSPDGTRISRKNGIDVTIENREILTEAGTYYMAVHDLESSANKARISYCLMNRNAIISHTPTSSSGSGLLLVGIDGNGMKELQSAALVNGDERVEATKITASDDNYYASLMFELSEQSLGEYDIVADFKNSDNGSIETVVRDKAIAIEQAVTGEIMSKIVPSGMRGVDVYPIALTITNTGNTPYWGIPVYLAAENNGNGNSIIFKDFVIDHPSLEKYPQEAVFYTDNLFGLNRKGAYCPMVLPYLGPNETITLNIGLHASVLDPVNIYFRAGEPWSKGFQDMLSPDYDFSVIADLPSSNLMEARDILKMCTSNNVLNGLSNKPCRAPSAGDYAETALNVSQAVGMTIGGTINGMGVQSLDARVQAYGIDLSDPAYSSLANLRGNLSQSMPSPMAIIATALGIDDIYQGVEQAMSNHPVASGQTVSRPGSGDPNEMHGYTAPGGGNYVGIDVKTLGYSIEFENDPKIADAPALTVVVTNQFDSDVFNLESFKTLEVTIGDRTVNVPSTHEWTKTIDMRPEINSVAQVNFNYDKDNGIATWRLISMDPMSMEATDYFNQGFLPVNDESGKGIGFLSYSIDLKDNLSDGTKITNSAEIVFDTNEPIQTPVYVNTTDYRRPTSQILSVDTGDATTFDFTVEGRDDASGIWYYDLYLRNTTKNSWELIGGKYESDSFSFTSDKELDNPQFMVVAVDRAGNIQDGVFIDVVLGDADGNGVVNANDAVVIRNYYVGKTDVINALGADASLDGKINAQDALAVRTIYLGTDKIKQLKKQRTRKK